MHPQRPLSTVIDTDDLHIAQSHQQLADARRVTLHSDPPDSAVQAAPILGDPSRSAADPHRPDCPLISEEPLWSYADLMALRIVYWLRHPKKGRGGEIAASSMQRVSEALAELERQGLNVWDDSEHKPDSPLRFDASAKICLVADGVAGLDGQHAVPGTLDLLGSFECGEQRGA